MRNEDMLTAAEFAKFCGTTRDTLLWYDKMNLLKPGRIGENGYRYYHITQYIRYDIIQMMKQTGSSLTEIRALLSDLSKGIGSEFFETRIKVLTEQIKRLSMMKMFTSDIKSGIYMSETCEYGKPELTALEPGLMVAVKLDKAGNSCPEEGFAEFARNYSRLRKLCKRDESVHNYPLGVILSLEGYKKGNIEQLYYFFDTDGESGHPVIRRPGGSAVAICHKGRYDNIKTTLDTAFQFIKSQKLEAYDNIYEYDIYAFLTDSRDDTAFKLIIPVQPARDRD